jgi:hypothetical protein
MESWIEICWKRTGVPYARAEMCRGVFKNWQLSGGGIRTNWIGPQVLNRTSRIGSIA